MYMNYAESLNCEKGLKLVDSIHTLKEFWKEFYNYSYRVLVRVVVCAICVCLCFCVFA